MNKKFKVDIDSFNAINEMDNIYAGITPKEEKPAIKVMTKKVNDAKIDHKKTTDDKGRINKKNNYTIVFKIDADLEDYLKNILWINRKSRNAYVNDLIRADMLKRLKLKDNVSYEELITAWEEYKKANNI